MKIENTPLEDVRRYVGIHEHRTLEDWRFRYDQYMRVLNKFHKVTPETRILEVGTGAGAFPVQCKLDGLNCRGLEISPELIEFAKKLGRKYGVEPDMELGNLEESDLGEAAWDIIVASNVFEHVEFWRLGVEKIYRALKPGGLMYFESTNKFSFVSYEYQGVPLYGWMPDGMRYALRKKVQGPEIMKLGIDFHQFRHGQLRRAFREVGFSQIYDRVDMTEEDWTSTGLRKWAVRLSRRSSLVKALALTFSEATRFACIK